MPNSQNLPSFTFAQLVHQWSPPKSAAEPDRSSQSTDQHVPEAQVEADPPAMSKVDRLQYVGGIRRIEVKREPCKGAALNSPLGQQHLALMQSMKKTS